MGLRHESRFAYLKSSWRDRVDSDVFDILYACDASTSFRARARHAGISECDHIDQAECIFGKVKNIPYGTIME